MEVQEGQPTKRKVIFLQGSVHKPMLAGGRLSSLLRKQHFFNTNPDSQVRGAQKSFGHFGTVDPGLMNPFFIGVSWF